MSETLKVQYSGNEESWKVIRNIWDIDRQARLQQNDDAAIVDDVQPVEGSDNSFEVTAVEGKFDELVAALGKFPSLQIINSLAN